MTIIISPFGVDVFVVATSFVGEILWEMFAK